MAQTTRFQMAGRNNHDIYIDCLWELARAYAAYMGHGRTPNGYYLNVLAKRG
jgi:hypothetical protein